MANARFKLGNHEFYLPTERAPLSRWTQKKRAPIAGAQSPSFLTGFTREPATSKSAKELLKGKFCGHGEPTYTVFDIVCDGHDELDALARTHPDPDLVLVRVPGNSGPWLVIFDLAWCDEGVPKEPQWHTLDEETEIGVKEVTGRAFLSIGFEYPCDADDVNSISWLTIDVWPQGHSGTPVVLVDREWE
jgi:hypothetical protein